MRDDVYPLSRAERRAALAAWRAVPVRVRWETGRLAERGSPAQDPVVGDAARRYGELLLRKHAVNRLPRCALTVVGALLLLAGLLVFGVEGGGLLAVLLVAEGVAVTSLGIFCWMQRRGARTVVAANPPVDASTVC